MPVTKKNKIGMHCILSSLYFLLLPLTISVNSTGASFLKVLTVPISLYFVVTLLFCKQEFKLNLVHILLALYTVTTVLTMFANPTADNVSLVIGYFLNAALFICLSVINYNEKELRVLEYVQVVLLAIITFITLYNDSTVNDRTTLIIFGQQSDPNYFVGYFIFPFAVTMKKICESKYRIFYILIAAFGMYAVFLSGSRGGLMAVLVTIASFAVLYPKKAWQKLILLSGMLLSVMVLWLIFSPYLSDTVTERMSVSAVVESGGTHRTEIWSSMLKTIANSKEEFIFGRGLGVLHPMFVAGKEDYVVAHNHLIQVMYEQGLIGIIAFVLLIGGCGLRCLQKRTYVTVALIGMMTLSISLSFNPSIKAFWNLIPYAAFVFPMADTSKSEEKQITDFKEENTYETEHGEKEGKSSSHQ